MKGNDLGNSLFIGNEAVLFFCSSCLSDNPAGIKNPVKQCYSRILKELIAAETALICANKILKQRMLTWVERYDKASVEAKHMIIAALVDRIEIGENYEVHIQFKVSAEQFIRQTA